MRVFPTASATATLWSSIFPCRAVSQLSQSGLINYISPDRPVLTSGHIENTTGATAVRGSLGSTTTLDGTGIGIAVLDSGIFTDHSSFKNGTTSRVVYSQSFVPNESAVTDSYGHGTHVASLAAGSSNRDNGAYRGIAPNAKIINLKVLNNLGIGNTAWLLNALEWIKVNNATYNIKVVNLSLGGLAIDSYTNDPVCIKVQQLNALGIVVVAAAGNLGKNILGQKEYGHIHSPGNDPSVITVGAVNTLGTDPRNDDSVTTFSSRGPTRSYYTTGLLGTQKVYDNAVKPDLVAPGNKLIAAAAPNNNIYLSNSGLSNSTLLSTVNTDSMMYMSGTSMSAPVVCRCRCIAFAGESETYAFDGQNDPAIYGSTTCRIQYV